MTRFDWKHWFFGNADIKGNGILDLLHNTEAVFLKMIHGIGFFFWERVPNFFHELLGWLHETSLTCARVVVRLVRVMVLILAWLGIVLGPLALYPGVISCIWMALALTGSVFGLRRRTLKMRASMAPAGTSPAELLEFLANGN